MLREAAYLRFVRDESVRATWGYANDPPSKNAIMYKKT
jgi:hypothetical protein